VWWEQAGELLTFSVIICNQPLPIVANPQGNSYSWKTSLLLVVVQEWEEHRCASEKAVLLWLLHPSSAAAGTPDFEQSLSETRYL